MATINVACKLPNGLIIEHKGKRAELLGANGSILVNGFGLTQVDADLFNGWTATYKDHPAVKNGLIFAHAQESSVKAQTKDHADLETGLEGIDPENPGKKAKLAPSQIAPADAA